MYSLSYKTWQISDIFRVSSGDLNTPKIIFDKLYLIFNLFYGLHPQ